MREHEVPTHVQAEDRVILWLTFPQIVAVTAVCALSYGAYRVAPFGPSGVRMALAAMMAAFGVAMIVGRVGGRRLPLVAADLLRFALGPRLHAGPASELVRSEPPLPPAPPAGAAARGGRRRGRRLMRRARRAFRPHAWFGKRRRRRWRGGGLLRRARQALDRPGARRWPAPDAPRMACSALRPSRALRAAARRCSLLRRRWPRLPLAGLAAAALAAAAIAAPDPAAAQDPGADPEEVPLWDLSAELEFEPADPVPGRRLYYEELRIVPGRAHVRLRAATDLEVRARAFGGPGGRELRFWGAASLDVGAAVSFSMPLVGDSPSLTFSWVDGIGQAGALSITAERIPHPLPAAQGEICDLAVTSVSWRPGRIEGTVAATCAKRLDERVRVWTAVGHERIGMDAGIDSAVDSVSGTLTVTDGGFTASSALAPDSEASFSLPVARGESLRTVRLDAALSADLSVPLPRLVRLTHRPARSEVRTRTVSLLRPGTGRTVTRTVTVTHPDGTKTKHDVSAYLSIPSKVITRQVSVSVYHPAHVRAKTEARSDLARTRSGTVALGLAIGADADYAAMSYPAPPPADPSSTQRRAQPGELVGWP